MGSRWSRGPTEHWLSLNQCSVFSLNTGSLAAGPQCSQCGRTRVLSAVLCGYAALRDALVLQVDAFSRHRAVAAFERFTHGNGEVPAVEART
jgi:hypothetical protein